MGSEIHTREALLERYGNTYGQLGLAIAFTRSIEGEDAKRCTTDWHKTTRLPDGPFGAGLLKNRGLTHNPVVVLRESGLIGIECDTPEGLAEIQSLELPVTVTVQSSEPYKLHFWFKPDTGCSEFAAFRFESAGITADRGRYLLVPPALHPSGSVYAFLRSPEDTEIAVLPAEKYEEIVRRAGKAELELRERLSSDPAAKIGEGQRGTTIFRFACSQQAFGVPPEVILEAALALNESRCSPPLSRRRVELQVHGALQYKSGSVEPWEIDLADGDDDHDELTLSTVRPRNVDWHWKPFVLVSGFHMLYGRGGSGKGSYLALLSAAMTRGESEYLVNDPRNVIIVSSEDSASMDLAPRFIAAGADRSRVFVLKRSFLLPRDIDYLERKILKERNGAPTGVVIIDPIANHIGAADTNNEGAVRLAINELNLLADRTNTTIIGVRHPAKDGNSMLGSTAWRDLPRIALEMRPSESVPYTPEDRTIRVEKSNRGPKDVTREYEIQRVAVDGLEELVPRLVCKTFPQDQP